MTTATQEITVRVLKTIQEQQYEPLTVDITIKETCPKKKYNERLAELTGLIKEEVFLALDINANQPEEESQFEEGGEEESQFEEGGEEESQFEEGEIEEGEIEEGEIEEGEIEEGEIEEGEIEEGEIEEGEIEEGEVEEGDFGDFFDDDPGREAD